MFNQYRREEILHKVESETYDLLIVGGGITGAGCARDAASRGMSVLLIDANDFAFGTSSRSSKLVHGGIRYLENFEFGLVHEALTERQTLLNIAPHLVHPLRFMIPIYETSRVGLLKMEAGMMLYDLLSFFDAPQLHEMHFRKGTEKREPLLKKDQLSGCVMYSDAYMEDDRLVIETLRSASELGADCVNYVKATGLTEGVDGCEVELKDSLNQKTYRVKAHQVVSGVGPWTDLFGRDVLKKWTDVLRPTKGIHLVFQRNKLPVRQAVVMAVEERIVFVIPRDNVVIVGTTDTDFSGDPANVNTDAADVEYLLSVTNKYFPTANLQKSDISSCYAGVRPLVKDQASTESKTSREHEIFNHSPRVTVVAGGKYTTYRAMAEEIIDSVLQKLPFDERMTLKASSTRQPLNPRVTEEKIERLLLHTSSMAEEFRVPEQTVRYLIRRHGGEGLFVLQMMKAAVSGDLEERLWTCEARFAINHCMCLNLVDFYWRRSPLFLFAADHGLRFLRPLAAIFAAKMNWTEAQTEAQIKLVETQVAADTAGLR